MEGQKFFSKIGTSTEKEEVFRLIELTSPQLTVFDEKLKQLVFSIEQVIGHEVTGKLRAGAPSFEDEVVTVNFSLRDKQYFLKSRCARMVPRSDQLFHFDFSGDLYKLQRRANFRVRVPADRKFLMQLIEANGRVLDESYRIYDLSAGGLAVLVPRGRSIKLERGQRFRARLKIGFPKPFDVKGTFRYLRPATAEAEYSSIAGFQFLGLEVSEEQELVSLIMDIYRELFSANS